MKSRKSLHASSCGGNKSDFHFKTLSRKSDVYRLSESTLRVCTFYIDVHAVYQHIYYIHVSIYTDVHFFLYTLQE